MEIFLSWSGERSKALAESFKKWLPNVLQYVNPYMSSQDIQLGERWSNNIEENLRNHDFGLVFVTEENITAPWINFEAGALSKSLQSRLIPLIYKSEVTLLNEGPLKQFQSQKSFEKESIHDLIRSINSGAREDQSLKADRLDGTFEKWWPDLEKDLLSVEKIQLDSSSNVKSVEENEDKKLLLAILNKVDNMERKGKNTGGDVDPSNRMKSVLFELRGKIELSKSMNRSIAADLRNNDDFQDNLLVGGLDNQFSELVYATHLLIQLDSNL